MNLYETFFQVSSICISLPRIGGSPVVSLAVGELVRWRSAAPPGKADGLALDVRVDTLVEQAAQVHEAVGHRWSSRFTSTHVTRRQPGNGLMWEHIAPDWTMTKRTTKTGAVVTFDLTALPLAFAELQRVKPTDRHGAVIVDEAAGRPYAENRYQQEWRKVADAADVPREVKNMDARSGGATEADEAGAARSDIQRGMAHSDPKTTSPYVRGDALEQAGASRLRGRR